MKGIKGVMRAKGTVWFEEERTHACTFQLSGRGRLQCLRGERWETRPCVQLVVIGSFDEAAVRGALDAALAVRDNAASSNHALADEKSPTSLSAVPPPVPQASEQASSPAGEADVALLER